MIRSSARPEHLRRYAADTLAAVTAARRDADVAAVAATRFAATGGDGGLAMPAVLAARSALDGLGTLADATRCIGDAFAAADTGAAGEVVTASDLGLSRSLQANAAGIADDELLAPMRFAAGQAYAKSLAGLSIEARLEKLEQIEHEEEYGPAFAAGVVNTLGADGLTDLTEDARVAYESGELGLNKVDKGFDALGIVLQDADRTVVPVIDPAGLGASMSDAGSARTEYDLDLEVLEELGQSAQGRNALRHLTLNAPDLSTPVTVTIAQAIARPHRVDLDRPQGQASFKLLDDRQVLEWDLAAPELPMLIILGRDPLAAFTWDQSRPGGRSPLDGYLPHRGPEETDELARITHSVMVDSVRLGWAAPYEVQLDGHQSGGHSTTWAEPPVSIHEVLRALGQANPTPLLTETMAEITKTHIEAFRELAAAEVTWDVHDPILTDYFRVLAADREALQTATANALDGYHNEAARYLAEHPPTSRDYTDLTTALADSRGVLQSVERGAIDAGKHHNAVAAFAVSATTFGLNKALGLGAGATGPVAGPVIATGGGLAIDAGAKAATDRWVDTQDGRSEKGAKAAARSEPYLVAVAMAEDPEWGEVVVDAGALQGLDVVDSAADRRAFADWLLQQPPVVRKPLVAIIGPAT